MDNMFYIVTGLLGFLLSGIWYATNIFLLNTFANKGWKVAGHFSLLLASLLPLAAISLYRGYSCSACIIKTACKKEILIELITSFIFSMGIGYVFYSSECFLFGMLAHIAERMISNLSKNGIQEYAVRHKKDQND